MNESPRYVLDRRLSIVLLTGWVALWFVGAWSVTMGVATGRPTELIVSAVAIVVGAGLQQWWRLVRAEMLRIDRKIRSPR